MQRLPIVAAFALIAAALVLPGCRRDQEQTASPSANNPADTATAPADHAPRVPPEFVAELEERTASGSLDQMLPPDHPPIGTMPAHPPMSGDALPPGHPPIGNAQSPAAGSGNALPPNHPPIGGQSGPVTFSGDMNSPEQMLQLNPPDAWTKKPARPMTVAIYNLPKPEGGRADADLAVSHYPGMKHVPLKDHVDRWAEQFSSIEQPDSGEAVKQTGLEDTAHPTTLVDISGALTVSPMMGGDGKPQENYRMLAALVETEQGPWFLKLTGPKETVAAHEEEFVRFVRQAK